MFCDTSFGESSGFNDSVSDGLQSETSFSDLSFDESLVSGSQESNTSAGPLARELGEFGTGQEGEFGGGVRVQLREFGRDSGGELAGGGGESRRISAACQDGDRRGSFCQAMLGTQVGEDDCWRQETGGGLLS